MRLSPPRAVPDVLARASALVTPALRDAVGRLGDELAPLAAYHLGWVDTDGRPAGSGGKGLRGALAILSAEAVGAAPAVAVPGAVAIELTHNFSLLHDDIIDGDRERRHRPTVWAVHGVGRAIILGDALVNLATSLLLEVPGAPGVLATRELLDATGAMIDGQADDMAFEMRSDVSLDECVAMERRKTGALLGCAAAIGAILADAPAPAVDALRDYGVNVGLGFQAVDDLLGIWGDPERTGKPRGSDLDGRKKSYPIAAALAGAAPYAAELRNVLGNGALDDASRHRAAYFVDAAGGRERAEQFATASLERALAALDHPDLDARAVTELRELAAFCVDREY
jgi:geranylgeranyl diphosphate synthase type I